VTDVNNTGTFGEATLTSNPAKLFICGDSATIEMSATVATGGSTTYIGWRIETESGCGKDLMPVDHANPNEGNPYAPCNKKQSALTVGDPAVRRFYAKAFCDGNMNCVKDADEDYYYAADGSVIEVQVFLAKVEIAMDGDRDGTINFNDPDDAKYLFWVNDDHDTKHYNSMEHQEQEDDSAEWFDAADTSPNCDDDHIGMKGGKKVIDPGGTPGWENPPPEEQNCRRDLEDFTPLHIRVDNSTATASGITYWLQYATTTTDTPKVNIFKAVVTNTSYLTDGAIADDQIKELKLLSVADSEVPLPNANIKAGNVVSPFILEGAAPGKGDLTIIVRYGTTEICRKAVTLELRPITKCYQVFRIETVGEVSEDETAGWYNSDFTKSDDYLLWVHGFNVNAIDKAYWPGTIFKRLWWRGYTGHFGWFEWPCETVGWLELNADIFDNSENTAWQCGDALLDRINKLNSGGHSGKVRLVAHSQGNIMAGEALRNASGVVLHTYIATQAAIAGDHYQAGLIENPEHYWQPFPTTPTVISKYPVSPGKDAPYLSTVFGKVLPGRVHAYYNPVDYALRSSLFSWERNNAGKPDLLRHYTEGDGVPVSYEPSAGDRFYRDTVIPFFFETTLEFPLDRFDIFSYAAEARSFAVGTDPPVGFVGNRDLGDWEYDGRHYSHSRQLRSNIVDEHDYWSAIVEDCALSTSVP
jgi:hypothetical protein